MATNNNTSNYDGNTTTSSSHNNHHQCPPLPGMMDVELSEASSQQRFLFSSSASGDCQKSATNSSGSNEEQVYNNKEESAADDDKREGKEEEKRQQEEDNALMMMGGDCDYDCDGDVEAPPPPPSPPVQNQPTKTTHQPPSSTTGRFRLFPEAFYDPNTKKLMTEPVVAPNGISFEKKSITIISSELPQDEEDDEGVVVVEYYPNRALESYIEDKLEEFGYADHYSGSNMRGTLMKWSKSLKSKFQKELLEKSPLLLSSSRGGEYRPLPDTFYCPISFELIHEPVIDPDGHTYEKGAIVHWLQKTNESPITRKPLHVNQLRDNTNLLRVFEFLAAQVPEEEDDEDEENNNGIQSMMIHPSIRQWKSEHSSRIISGPEIVPPSPDNKATATDEGSGYPTRPTMEGCFWCFVCSPCICLFLIGFAIWSVVIALFI